VNIVVLKKGGKSCGKKYTGNNQQKSLTMVFSFKNLPNNISLCDNLRSFYSAKTILCLPVGEPIEKSRGQCES
jgi:hypothetical protein